MLHLCLQCLICPARYCYCDWAVMAAFVEVKVMCLFGLLAQLCQ